MLVDEPCALMLAIQRVKMIPVAVVGVGAVVDPAAVVVVFAVGHASLKFGLNFWQT